MRHIAKYFRILCAGAIMLTPLVTKVEDVKMNRHIAGAYMCDAKCRVWDSSATIQIDAKGVITCQNEIGEHGRGRRLSASSIICFNKIGRLLKDGQTIKWEDGGQWVRGQQQSF